MTCGVCNGRGQVEDAVRCTSCGGSGSNAGFRCSYCEGTGSRRGTVTCTWCGGTGGLNPGAFYSGSSGYSAGNGNVTLGGVIWGAVVAGGLLLVVTIFSKPAGTGATQVRELSGWALTALGVLIALAIPVSANFLREDGAKVAWVAFLWMLAIVAMFIVLQIVLYQFTGSSLLHILREAIRDLFAPVRAIVSPARLIQLILPQSMAGTAWLIAFSLILTIVSMLRPVYEDRYFARISAAGAILVGCFVLL